MKAIYRVEIPGKDPQWMSKDVNGSYSLVTKMSVAAPIEEHEHLIIMDFLPEGTTAYVEQSSIQLEIKDIWRAM